MKVTKIDHVIDALGEIAMDARGSNSRLGFFPALYRKTTIQVKEGIEEGRFEDPARMEQLDVVFAHRYLDAYRQHRTGRRPPKAWAYAFEMAAAEHPIVLQHLLLGMNAHINLDLGIAAVEACPGESLQAVKADFFEISDILQDMIDAVQHELNELSPGLSQFDRWGMHVDEALCNFAIRKARQEAWQSAQLLNRVPDHLRPFYVSRRDMRVSVLARLICPRIPLNPLLLQLRQTEVAEPRTIIDALL